MARDTGQAEQRNDVEERAQFVEWTGDPLTGSSASPFEERVISAKDLRDTYGVELPSGTRELRWNAQNRHRIPVSDLPNEVIQVLTNEEANFRVTDKR